jgi:hypothetical protein
MYRSMKVKQAFHGFLVLLFFFSLPWPFTQPVCSSSSSDNPRSDSRLIYTSAGHMLEFSTAGVILASDDHMLKTEFIQPNPVSPVADNSVSGNSRDFSALSRVTYHDLWDGVNLVYCAAQGAVVESIYYLESPDAADYIRLGYNRPLSLDSAGDLVISYESGTLRESAPLAWQEVAGEKIPVAAAFRLYGELEVGFVLGKCLPGVPIVIDPATTWTTFLGGTSIDYGYGIAVDGSGNVYVCGTSSAAWQGTADPVRDYSSYNDAFVAKLDRNGNLTWHTFLGGSGDDYGRAIAVDSIGNVYICGDSSASWHGDSLPRRAFSAVADDAFAAKLDNDGNLVWSTFLGGNNQDSGYGIAVDSSGNVYACGFGQSGSWPGELEQKRLFYGGVYEAFAAKMDNNGYLVWYTLLGGATPDLAYGIAVDSSGNSYVCGNSNGVWQGTADPVRDHSAGLQDAFAAKLDSSGNIVWYTFLGGTLNDLGRGIAVDSSGNVYACGYGNSSWGSPIRVRYGDYDAFAAKLDSSGKLTWNTFLGGYVADQATTIAVNSTGSVLVGGKSRGVWQGTSDPMRAFTTPDDVFVAKLDSGGNLSWHTFLGGDGADQCNGIALDGSGNVAVCGSSDYPWQGVLPPVRAFSDSSSVDYYPEAFAAKLNSSGELVLPVPEISLKVGHDNFTSGGTYDFGARAINSMSRVKFTVENLGYADLNIITPLSISGMDAAQFSLIKQPLTPVAAEGETTFTVSFNPSSVGLKTASITILDNDTDEGNYIINLTGEALYLGVGGEVQEANKLGVLFPCFILAFILSISRTVLWLKRRGWRKFNSKP